MKDLIMKIGGILLAAYLVLTFFIGTGDNSFKKAGETIVNTGITEIKKIGQ